MTHFYNFSSINAIYDSENENMTIKWIIFKSLCHKNIYLSSHVFISVFTYTRYMTYTKARSGDLRNGRPSKFSPNIFNLKPSKLLKSLKSLISLNEPLHTHHFKPLQTTLQTPLIYVLQKVNRRLFRTVPSR